MVETMLNAYTEPVYKQIVIECFSVLVTSSNLTFLASRSSLEILLHLKNTKVQIFWLPYNGLGNPKCLSYQVFQNLQQNREFWGYRTSKRVQLSRLHKCVGVLAY